MRPPHFQSTLRTAYGLEIKERRGLPRRQRHHYLRSALQPMTTLISLGLGGSRVVDEIDALPIRRHVVLRPPVPRSDERHVQRDSWTERQLSSRSASHRSATKMAFAIDVEQLLPVAAPDGLAAAIVGHHETPGWTDMARTDTSGRPASSETYASHCSVGRYPRVVLGERPGENRLGRTAGRERHAPHIAVRTIHGQACVDDEIAPVGRPVGRLAVRIGAWTREFL